MSDHESDPPRSLMDEARAGLRDEDWVGAIRAFLGAVQESPRDAEPYLGLIRSYEAAAEEYGDPELLEQASKVCRDALGLTLDEGERAWVVAAAGRIKAKLESLAEESEEAEEE